MKLVVLKKLQELTNNISQFKTLAKQIYPILECLVCPNLHWFQLWWDGVYSFNSIILSLLSWLRSRAYAFQWFSICLYIVQYLHTYLYTVGEKLQSQAKPRQDLMMRWWIRQSWTFGSQDQPYLYVHSIIVQFMGSKQTRDIRDFDSR